MKSAIQRKRTLHVFLNTDLSQLLKEPMEFVILQKYDMQNQQRLQEQ